MNRKYHPMPEPLDEFSGVLLLGFSLMLVLIALPVAVWWLMGS